MHININISSSKNSLFGATAFLTRFCQICPELDFPVDSKEL
jgi:hypothetical protein